MAYTRPQVVCLLCYFPDLIYCLLFCILLSSYPGFFTFLLKSKESSTIRHVQIDVPILGNALSQITSWLVLQLSFNFAQVSSDQWHLSWPLYLKFILCAWSIINKSEKNKTKTKHQEIMTFEDLVYRWCNSK